MEFIRNNLTFFLLLTVILIIVMKQVVNILHFNKDLQVLKE
jgi:hypothetical protein